MHVQADEGRSFLSKAGGGTRQGEKLVDERVNIYSDPYEPRLAYQYLEWRWPATGKNIVDRKRSD
jgi:hypothetical protein